MSAIGSPAVGIEPPALFDDPHAERVRDMQRLLQMVGDGTPALMERWDRERP
ncbi:hypothetical protein LX16_3719 [Stackebrandtia albiflava]|uniref:Uncharacterized protein n=1 Tax=Stackebrandtia albiflava TaxID=406432 RepID=A0A562V546_9ACTN|nr:hypothetical protein LX16_3719 [Stackebrandtia albiflava]